jgi:hypothetical protein
MKGSYLVSRNTKKILYRSIIRPLVAYGEETSCLAANDRNSLGVWERKVLRKIYGLVCENGAWRIRTNTELMELCDELDIVTKVKWMRLRWLGHVERISDDRSTEKLYSNKPEGLRLVRRPRKRWLDEVEQNLKQMAVRGWRRRTKNRDEWRSIVKEAKVLHGPQHQGVSQSE